MLVALAFIPFILTVVKQARHLTLAAEIGQPAHTGGEIITLMVVQRDAFLPQRLLQTAQIIQQESRLTRRHRMAGPLLRRGDKHRLNPCVGILAGGVQRQIIGKA